MASSGAPPPVPSNYQPIFEGYWKQCDAGNTGKVVAVDAASFLKSSQLKESTLHKIWTLVDPKGKGYLDKEAFFTAVRLVAVCQAGKEPTISNITAKDPLPQFNPVKPSTKPWIIDAEERKRSISMFHNMQPEKGKVSGEKAKQMFLKSGLSTDVLGKIWTLSDTDCDGALTISEFSIAIHLIARCRGGEPVPTVLPPALKIAASSISSSPLPVKRESSSGEWLITPEMKAKYDQYFSGIDKDKDGFVTGDESKGLFMASNLPSAVLAEIWNLIDTKSSGKLNAEQFAVAMYLISEKVKGGEIPKPLPANLIPPSMREEAVAKVSTAPTQSLTPLKTPSNVPPASSGTILPPVMAPSKTTPVPASQPSVTIGTDSMDGFSAIKQLDSLNTELESLTKEKESLQHEVREKEKAIVDSKDEVQVLKESLAKVQFTCQELGKEKMAAQEQLDRLDQEKTSVEKQLTDAKREIEELKSSVEQVRTTLQGKEEAMKAQSEELQKLQSDLHDLKKEEAQLKIEVDSSREDLQKAQQSVGKTKAEITQTQKKIASLKTEKKTITDTFAEITNLSFDTAVPPGKTSTDGPDEGLLHLRSEVDSVSAVATAGSSSPLSSVSGLSEFEHKDESTSGSKMTSDPFGSTTSEDPFSSMGGFGGNSSFGSNSFSKTPTGTSTTASNFSDPFTGTGDPFKSPTSSNVSSDPFGGDPFGVKGTTTSDPFKTPPAGAFSGGDPFQSTGHLSSDPFKPSPKDPFSSNPFGADFFQSKPAENTVKSDPFSSGKGGSDPFGFTPENKTPTSKDPFSDSFGDAFGSSGFSKTTPTSSSSNSSMSGAQNKEQQKKMGKQDADEFARVLAETLNPLKK